MATRLKRRADPAAIKVPGQGVSAEVLLLREQLLAGAMKTVAKLELGALEVEIGCGDNALWALIRRPRHGGLALRAAHVPGGCRNLQQLRSEDGQGVGLKFNSAIGRHEVRVTLPEEEVPVLRVTSTLTPDAPLLVPFLPRDLYPLDEDDDPTGACGTVEAAQRGLNAGLSFFRIEEPDFGTALYFQNLTTLNPYFTATHTKPDAAVGGEWPEIGYLPPTPPQSGTPPINPLPAGEPVTMSDTLIALHEDANGDEQAMARRYLALLGAVYRLIDRPPTHYHDWIERAERTLRDLDQSSKATINHYGHRYIHPYTATEYPDVMVQVSVLAAIRDYEAWTGEPIALKDDFVAGLGKFYDGELKTLRRYLPNVGDDKDKDAVDSWYLYHPLLNLGRLALDGDKRAKQLFRKSIDYGIKAAHHFRYRWPIQYKVTDFSVIQEARNDDGLGQTDVGGIYAYVMLQAFDLTDDKKYLDEARAAIDATAGMRFELNYQANLTAWGAAACMRLWRITDDETYLRQSYVYVASFFHNVAVWQSSIDNAAHYSNFLGVSALHDGPYMAVYECFDSYAAFERYLKDSGPDLDPAIRMLVTEYCRYAVDRAWFFYPDSLPEDAIAKQVRNGHIDRALSFPVEDLYVGGQPAGQVGQEIYGCGAAFVFASRAYHDVSDAPFRMFCDHFVVASERPAKRSFSFQLGGTAGCTAKLCLIRKKRARLPGFTVRTLSGDELPPEREGADRIEYEVGAGDRITITW
jgi:hypothetical protein